MTDAQRKIFIENLNKFFELIEQGIKGETLENEEKIEKWGKNVYGRYRYALNGERKNNALPEEHVTLLKQKLKEKNITPEEYEKSKGKIKELTEILKQKEQQEEIVEVYTLEELKKIQEENDKKINTLRSKHTERYKKMYHLTEQEYKDIEQELNELIQKRKQINLLIEQQKCPETKEKSKEPTQYNKKITELMKTNQELQDTNQELEEQIKKYETNKTSLREEYSKKYEKRLEEKANEVKEKYEETLEIEKNKIKLECQRRINDKQNQIEELQQKLSNQENQRMKNERIIKEKQKEIILKLLCSNAEISIDRMKKELEYRNINAVNIRDVLRELKTEIPGLNKKINEEGKEFTYSLIGDAKKQLDEYRTWNICPTINAQENGTFSFIVRSDMHLNMNSSEDTIKRIFSPYLDFSSTQNNLPIIDLGDLADTRRPFTQQDWEKGNKEAIKYAYNFYKNYAKTINTAKNINHYTLFGNHDIHPYLAGVDPLEIIYEYSNNINLLGVSNGAFRIGKDKIGAFHDRPFGNIISFKDEHNKEKRNNIIYSDLSENVKKIANDYIYSLIGHYHFGAHNPQEQFSVINNGIENSLLFTAEIKDGQIEKMYVTELYLIDNVVRKSGYQTEIYNKQKTIKK